MGMARRGKPYRFYSYGRRAASVEEYTTRRTRALRLHGRIAMSTRSRSAAKALLVLTAAGLLLSGCYYHHPYYGAPQFGPPSYGYQHHYRGEGKHRGYGGYHHGYRGYY